MEVREERVGGRKEEETSKKAIFQEHAENKLTLRAFYEMGGRWSPVLKEGECQSRGTQLQGDWGLRVHNGERRVCDLKGEG